MIAKPSRFLTWVILSVSFVTQPAWATPLLVQPVAATRFTYEPTFNQVTSITDPNGNVTQIAYDAKGNPPWTHGPGIDEPLMMERDLNANGTFESTERFFYHLDGLGSTVALTNSSGQVVERYRYDSFGNPAILGPGPDGLVDTGDDVVLAQSAFGNPYLFTGREFDPETGLYFLRARYYDPQVGRFLQRDPIDLETAQLPLRKQQLLSITPALSALLSDPAVLNSYPYVANDPVNNVDPTGEQLSTTALVVILAALILSGTLLAQALKSLVTDITRGIPFKTIIKKLEELRPYFQERQAVLERAIQEVKDAAVAGSVSCP